MNHECRIGYENATKGNYEIYFNLRMRDLPLRNGVHIVLCNVVCTTVSFQVGGFSNLGEISPEYQSPRTMHTLG